MRQDSAKALPNKRLKLRALIALEEPECGAPGGHGLRPAPLRRPVRRPQLKPDPLASTAMESRPEMPPFLSILLAIGGASFAWRAYSSLYERQRAASQPFDPVTHKWWRILSKAVGLGLLSFVLVVIGAAVQPAVPSPRWLAVLLLSLLAASLIVALVGVGALRRRAAR